MKAASPFFCVLLLFCNGTSTIVDSASLENNTGEDTETLTTTRDLKQLILRSNLKHLPPSKELDHLRKFGHLKAGSNPKVQIVELGDTSVTIDDTVYLVDDQHLIEIDLFTQDARYEVDGKAQYIHPTVSQHKRDPRVFVTKKSDRSFQSALMEGKEDIVEVTPGVFANIQQKDIDETGDDTKDIMGHDHLDVEDDNDEEDDEDPGGGGDRHLLRHHTSNLVAMENTMPISSMMGVNSTTKVITMSAENRNLFEQDPCYGEYTVVKMSVVIDSSMCARYGGSGDGAAADALTIIQQANRRFQAACTKLKVMDLLVYCNPKTDPIHPLIQAVIAEGGVVCNVASSSLIAKFGAQVGKYLKGHLTHLFYGHDFAGSVVGCAYTGGLCHENPAYRTGINKMTYTTWVDRKANLLSHEIGHGFGCAHVSSKNIMNKAIGSGKDKFKPKSVNTINDKWKKVKCSSKEVLLDVVEENFESGTFTNGFFRAGGRNARIRGAFPYQSSRSLDLRSNTGSSYVETRKDYRFEVGEKFRLSFFFSGRKLDQRSNDRFVVEAFNYSPEAGGASGGTWTTLQTFWFGAGATEGFDKNDVWHHACIASPMFKTATPRVRFRITAFLHRRIRKVFIDDVKLETLTVV